VVACAERPPARPYGDDRPVARESSPARSARVTERDQDRALDMAERAGELGRLAHIEHLHVGSVLLKARAGSISQTPAKL